MSTRRDFISLIGGAAAWPLAVSAQEPGRTYRLGGLAPNPREASQYVALVEELRRSGFIEGQNLSIVWRGYGQRIELVSELVGQLIKSKVDALFCGGDLAILAAQQATATIPIIGFTDDMLGSGLVKSLARPGGNTTGPATPATPLPRIETRVAENTHQVTMHFDQNDVDIQVRDASITRPAPSHRSGPLKHRRRNQTKRCHVMDTIGLSEQIAFYEGLTQGLIIRRLLH